MREFVGRFGETIHRPQPLLFYLPHLLHKFAPWIVLMVAIALIDLGSRNLRLRSVFREMAPETFWLVCWSIGGLIVMSLIPSKRVDRIFPVIPPLCLLLAAQINVRDAGLPRKLSGIGAARRPYLWSAIALLFAMLFSGGYTGWKVITGYRHQRNGLAIFGGNVRHEAESRHWRYEVVSAKDEGLLLYLRKTHFVELTDAITEWNNENLDALVVSKEKAALLARDLKGVAATQLESNEREREQGRGYVLITR
jgi:4-amino-4-deoxy-L-arabinose transferase-like glycosyltransferase